MPLRLLAASLLLALPLAACNQIPKQKIDMAALEKELKGPAVPTIAGSLVENAKKAEQAGEFEKAASSYKQLVDRDGEDVAYILGYAENLRRSNQCEPALQQYELLLSKNAKNVDALEGKALCLMNNADFNGAAKLFNEVMAMDATRWRTINASGILLALNKKVPEAVEYFREAIRLSNEHPSVLNNIGLTLAMNQDYVGAIKALELASSKSREGTYDKKRVELNLSMVYGLAGDPDKAEKYARRHLSEPALYNNLGLYASLANDSALARSYLNKALTQSTTHYEKAWDNLEAIEGRKPTARPGGNS